MTAELVDAPGGDNASVAGNYSVDQILRENEAASLLAADGIEGHFCAVHVDFPSTIDSVPSQWHQCKCKHIHHAGNILQDWGFQTACTNVPLGNLTQKMSVHVNTCNMQKKWDMSQKEACHMHFLDVDMRDLIPEKEHVHTTTEISVKDSSGHPLCVLNAASVMRLMYI